MSDDIKKFVQDMKSIKSNPAVELREMVEAMKAYRQNPIVEMTAEMKASTTLREYIDTIKTITERPTYIQPTLKDIMSPSTADLMRTIKGQIGTGSDMKEIFEFQARVRDMIPKQVFRTATEHTSLLYYWTSHLKTSITGVSALTAVKASKFHDYLGMIDGKRIDHQQHSPENTLYKVEYGVLDLLKPDAREEDVEQLIKKPGIIISEGRKLRQLIINIYKNNQALFKVSPREFEQLIAELLRMDGWDVDLTKQTRDGGYDILAVSKGDIPFRLLVECKRLLKQKVDVSIIRGFSHVIQNEYAHRGLIVTTSTFSRDAKKEPKNPYLLDFRDKDDVVSWIGRHAPILQ